MFVPEDARFPRESCKAPRLSFNSTLPWCCHSEVLRLTCQKMFFVILGYIFKCIFLAGSRGLEFKTYKSGKPPLSLLSWHLSVSSPETINITSFLFGFCFVLLRTQILSANHHHNLLECLETHCTLKASL